MLYNIHVVFDTLLRTKEGILSSDKEIKRPGDEALNFIGKDKKEKIKALKIKANIIEKKSVENFYKAQEETDKSIEKLNDFKVNMYKTTLKDFVEVVGLIKNINFIEKINLSENSETFLKKLLKDLEYNVNIKKDRVSIQIFTLDALNKIPEMLIYGTFFPILYPVKNAIESCLNLDKKIEEAETLLAYVRIVAEKNEVKILLLESTRKEVDNAFNTLDYLNFYLKRYIKRVNKIINKGFIFKHTNYSKYTKEERKTLDITFAIAQTLKTLCDSAIVNENGEIVEKSKEVLTQANNIISKIKEV